jgi:hypothetical protein
MFPPPLQKAFNIFCIHLITTKYQQFSTNKLFYKFVGANHHLKNVQAPPIFKKRNFQPWTMDANGDKTKNISNTSQTY